MKKIILSTAFAACSFFLSQAQPDLKVDNIRFEAEPGIGGPGETFTTLYVTIKNAGNKAAVGTEASPTKGYIFDIIISGDTYAPVRLAPAMMVGRYPEDCLVENGRINNTVTIKPYQTYTYVLKKLKILKGVDMHNPCGIGKFNIGVVVDSSLKIAESDEANNTNFKEFKLICR